MKATLLSRERLWLTDEVKVEIVIWQVPKPVSGCQHSYKYRLALVAKGICVLRYDNETGKGDHKHTGETETPYRFSGLDALVDDFKADVEAWRLMQ